MNSLRFEDLKEELNQLKDRICIKLKQGITEGVLNNFLSVGEFNRSFQSIHFNRIQFLALLLIVSISCIKLNELFFKGGR